MRIKKSLVILITFIVLIFLPALILPFSSERIASFHYRELLYSRISSDYQYQDKKKTVSALFKYVASNMHSSKDYNVVDKNAFTDAVRGVGWCDQQAFLLMNLLNKAGIDRTRLRDVQAHTYSEVYVDDKWVIIDPFFGFTPISERNDFLSLEDLSSSKTRDLIGVIDNKRSASEDFGQNYKNIYVPNEIRWDEGKGPEFLQYRAYDTARSVIELYSNFYYHILGNIYFDWVQDTHLKSKYIKELKDNGDIWVRSYKSKYKNNQKAFVLFYKARNYDLGKRLKNAESFYNKIIADFPESYWSQEAKYYLAVLKFQEGGYKKSKILLSDLHSNYLIRKDLVQYYLGLISLLSLEHDKARTWFSLSDHYLSKVELRKLSE